MNRTQAREWIVKMLYQYDVSKLPIEKILENFYEKNDPKEQREYIEKSLENILKNLDVIDKNIKNFSEKWDLTRMPKIDLAILRCSTYEILYDTGVPASVSINEAVEIAKKYSTENSYSFINGILGSIEKNAKSGGKTNGNN